MANIILDAISEKIPETTKLTVETELQPNDDLSAKAVQDYQVWADFIREFDSLAGDGAGFLDSFSNAAGWFSSYKKSVQLSAAQIKALKSDELYVESLLDKAWKNATATKFGGTQPPVFVMSVQAQGWDKLFGIGVVRSKKEQNDQLKQELKKSAGEVLPPIGFGVGAIAAIIATILVFTRSK